MITDYDYELRIPTACSLYSWHLDSHLNLGSLQWKMQFNQDRIRSHPRRDASRVFLFSDRGHLDRRHDHLSTISTNYKLQVAFTFMTRIQMFLSRVFLRWRRWYRQGVVDAPSSYDFAGSLPSTGHHDHWQLDRGWIDVLKMRLLGTIWLIWLQSPRPVRWGLTLIIAFSHWSFRDSGQTLPNYGRESSVSMHQSTLERSTNQHSVFS